MEPLPDSDVESSSPDGDEGPLWRRLAWLAAIWTGSVAVLALVAGILRAWLVP